MTISPEKQETQPLELKQDVEEVLENIEIPSDLERAGITPVVTQMPQAQTAGNFKPTDVIASDNTKTITLPATLTQLHSTAKGSINNAITWLARFWLRVFEKAVLLKWQIIGKPGDEGEIEKEVGRQDKQVMGNG